MSVKFPATPAKGKTEWKVKAAGLAAFVASLAGSIFLSTSAEHWVSGLPEWARVALYPLVTAGAAVLAGRAASTSPDYLSPSTIEAAKLWLSRHMPGQ